jgi:hypothetical protein
MGFAHARRAEQHHVLSAFEETHAGQLPHHLPIERGLKLEIERVQSLDPWESG